MAGDQSHTMLFGGSRSGKTFCIVRAYCIRALKFPGARQAMFRFRFNAVRSTLIADTFPKVMQLCFPGVGWRIDKTDWVIRFGNGSEIWFGGLDQKERTEKILGQEHCGIFLNECSQIPWSVRNIAVTRLAQNIGARLRMDYDCNPPTQSHWTYKLFVRKRDPVSNLGLADPENYAALLMNPADNRANLSDAYFRELENLPERLRKRFLKGEFVPVAENALWTVELLDRQRIVDTEIPDMQRVIVAVDPSGADDAGEGEEVGRRNAIGIIVAGLGADGLGYVLEDLTIAASPASWGRIAVAAYERHKADRIVAEENFGGAMVRHVIQTARARTPYKSVVASRGKVVRAEPIAALYEQGKIRHVGFFPELEDELSAFTTMGYKGEGSPNRADALVWAFTELFPGMTRGSVTLDIPPPPRLDIRLGASGWMR